MLEPIELRHSRIPEPLIMAPVAGVCNIAFRVLLERCGAREIFTEMASAEALWRGGQRTRSILARGPEENATPRTQIFGGKPEAMRAAASCCADLGYRHIDINMGCPVKKVLKSGAGSGLLCDPGRAAEIVAAVRDAVGDCADISVKTRLAWTSTQGDGLELARRVSQAGADLLSVHARTRAQGFSGQADWSAVRPFVEELDIPVLVNGDICDYDSCMRALELSHAAGVLIAREALSRPWVFAEIRARIQGHPWSEPDMNARFAWIRQHLALLLRHEPRRAHILIRKHAAWYLRGMAGSAELRRSIHRAASAAELLQMLACWNPAPEPQNG